MKVKISNQKPDITTADQMTIGQIAVIKNSPKDLYNGETVLLGYGVLISLSHPVHTWFEDRDGLRFLEVKILPPDTIVELTSEV